MLQQTKVFHLFELSAESELNRIRNDFVERVSLVILKQILDGLITDGVVNTLEKEAIIEENQTRADKARRLIDDVKKKGEEASKRMIKHLQTKDPALSSHLGLSSGQPALRACIPTPTGPDKF
ncbi:caspase recruitment domain-containing protein 18-like [Leuresthes tenuis]|uniref:caspase recruitment domain-containing protein 18-like n=1 Tax=Leuresthes tenuis TaxID=355514 RepID=UPI003B506655